MNSMRNLFIVGVSIFLGLSVPEYFFRYTMAAHRGPAHTKAGWVRLSLPFFNISWLKVKQYLRYHVDRQCSAVVDSAVQ
jgi:nucleobase transporter 1/2